MQDATIDQAQEQAEGQAEIEALAAKAQLGITYTETCTLAKAAESYAAIFGPLGGNLKDFLAERPGDFTFRRPSAMDTIRINVELDQMAKGADLRYITEAQIRAYLTCKHLLTKAPDWFKLEEEPEADTFLLLHHWYTEWSRSFRGRLGAPS